MQIREILFTFLLLFQNQVFALEKVQEDVNQSEDEGSIKSFSIHEIVLTMLIKSLFLSFYRSHSIHCHDFGIARYLPNWMCSMLFISRRSTRT